MNQWLVDKVNQLSITCILFFMLTFWVTIRNRRALNCGNVGVTPGILIGSECGESNTVLGFTIFSTSISHASRNSPVPSGRSVCSRPSETGTFPPIERAQLNVLWTNGGTLECIYMCESMFMGHSPWYVSSSQWVARTRTTHHALRSRRTSGAWGGTGTSSHQRALEKWSPLSKWRKSACHTK